MRNLFISLYKPQDKNREVELLQCLKKNRFVFDQVFVLMEGGYGVDQKAKNVYELPVTTRPTYRTFFKAINRVSHSDDLNVIANSDIYFDETIEATDKICSHDCYALTRYDDGVFMNRKDSQDVWMFRGHVRMNNGLYCDFHLGTPGCDNRIAWELGQAGYFVSNPSLSIKTHHVHSNPREHDRTKVVAMPYLKIEPTAL